MKRNSARPVESSTVRRTVLACGLALVLSTTGIAVAADPAAPRTIRVSANEVVKSAPDRAQVAISVVTRAATAREASQANAKTSRVLLETLRAKVPAPGEVRTAGYDLSAEYDYGQERGVARRPTLVGYVSTNRMSIVSADLDGIGALIDAAVASGATQIDSIGFFLEDADSVRRQALLQAGKKARVEGETVAQSLGLTLGEVLDASTVADTNPGPVMGRHKAMMVMDAEASTEMVPGSVEVSGSVTVTFAIR